MDIKQISVFLENKAGRLAEVTACLAQAGINIRALYLADTTDFGILRMIVNDPDRAQDVLRNSGFVVQETDVIAVEVEDSPGGLNKVLSLLNAGNINIEYMYAFVEKKVNNAIVVFKIDEQEKTIKLLLQNGIGLVPRDVLTNL